MHALEIIMLNENIKHLVNLPQSFNHFYVYLESKELIDSNLSDFQAKKITLSSIPLHGWLFFLEKRREMLGWA